MFHHKSDIPTFRTAEWARVGHPDRIADIIADAIVDEYLKEDPHSRVAVDVFACHGIITVGGEVSSKAKIDIADIVRQTYKEIGYDEHIGVDVNIVKQSPEIAIKALEGAGDSGIVTGYACNETPEMLPLETALAKRVAYHLDTMDILKPDGKVQVTLDHEDVIKTIVIAYQVSPRKEERAKRRIKREITRLLKPYLSKKTEWKLIPFYVGGLEADSGMTGRKNVLWYGPRVPIGGGCFAGKDATKVDRSGAYLARLLAIKWVNNTILQGQQKKEALVEIAYVIGEPLPLYIKINDMIEEREDWDEETFSLRSVIDGLELRNPVYMLASWYGHFGTDMFPWDEIN